MIVYAVFGIIMLALIAYIVHWRNLPEVIEQRRLQAEEAQKRRDERSDKREEAISERQKAREERRKKIFTWHKKENPQDK